MRKALALASIGLIGLAGCADKDALNHYYDVELTRTNLLIESAERQSADNASMRMHQMQAFSSAASTAAMTPDNTDDALLAFAWGFQMGQPMRVEIPKLQPLKAPDTDADMVRAWTPVLGIIAPFLYPLAYGWADSGGGTSYTATDNAKINIQSENAGSLNTAGNDMTSTVTDNRLQLENDCIDCGDGQGGGTVDPLSAEPTNTEEPGNELPGDTCDVTGGYLGPDGRIYADPSFTCSCGSRAAGNC